MRCCADDPAPCACDCCDGDPETCERDPQECGAEDADAHYEAVREMWD
ncbi:MAG TPA: hypothetical protein PLY91_07645 [Methanoregulaceae archaeon]|nr:hypothetical protein [Methanoregulaceae archaeon]